MMTTCGICYDLYLLYPGFRISQKHGISYEISTATTNIWKSIHKTALTGEQAREDNELDNHPDFAHPYIALTRLSEQLISTISIGLISEVVTSHSLNILPPNSDFIIVYNLIYLSLPLNQLHCLTFEGILDHAIKNKGKMYLDLD